MAHIVFFKRLQEVFPSNLIHCDEKGYESRDVRNYGFLIDDVWITRNPKQYYYMRLVTHEDVSRYSTMTPNSMYVFDNSRDLTFSRVIIRLGANLSSLVLSFCSVDFYRINNDVQLKSCQALILRHISHRFHDGKGKRPSTNKIDFSGQHMVKLLGKSSYDTSSEFDLFGYGPDCYTPGLVTIVSGGDPAVIMTNNGAARTFFVRFGSSYKYRTTFRSLLGYDDPSDEQVRTLDSNNLYFKDSSVLSGYLKRIAIRIDSQVKRFREVKKWTEAYSVSKTIMFRSEDGKYPYSDSRLGCFCCFDDTLMREAEYFSINYNGILVSYCLALICSFDIDIEFIYRLDLPRRIVKCLKHVSYYFDKLRKGELSSRLSRRQQSDLSFKRIRSRVIITFDPWVYSALPYPYKVLLKLIGIKLVKKKIVIPRVSLGFMHRYLSDSIYATVMGEKFMTLDLHPKYCSSGDECLLSNPAQ